MNPEELVIAEQLAQRWREGDNSAWPDLRRDMEKQLVMMAERFVHGLEPEQKRYFRLLLINRFSSMYFDQGDEHLRTRVNFQGFCAYAMRRIMVDIYRHLIELNEVAITKHLTMTALPKA